MLKKWFFKTNTFFKKKDFYCIITITFESLKNDFKIA